ncbi:glycosyltransferase [Actinokineospora sp. HUAS TT18]|uniref:glycosyltransferase n=1 Tax=Actinokineospora sp. HUAS TT18 TaxID=3447451 RepID=UPI003F51E9C0
MSRFLFVTPPLVGHLNPAVSIAAELDAMGHEVGWAVHENVVGQHLPTDATVFALEDTGVAAMFSHALALALDDPGRATWWEHYFEPLARAMIPGVERAVDIFRPDVLVVDRQALAGSVVARARDLRWATLLVTPSSLPHAVLPVSAAGDWFAQLIGALDRDMGLTPADTPICSADLVIATTIPQLLNGPLPAVDQLHLVGATNTGLPERTPFPFESLRGCPRVLVSLGTTPAGRGRGFTELVIDALADTELQVVLVTPERPPAVPDNFVVRPFVPWRSVLERMDAVVCHAGHNTVCDALTHALPLVVLPITADQPMIAQRVADTGVGIQLDFWQLNAAQLRDSVRRVLNEPQYRAAALDASRTLADSGGAAQAAGLLAGLA